MEQKEVSNKIEYLVRSVGEFASRHSLTNSQAYVYLKRFCGMDFLLSYYETGNHQSIKDVVEELTMVCHKNGGRLV